MLAELVPNWSCFANSLIIKRKQQICPSKCQVSTMQQLSQLTRRGSSFSFGHSQMAEACDSVSRVGFLCCYRSLSGADVSEPACLLFTRTLCTTQATGSCIGEGMPPQADPTPQGDVLQLIQLDTFPDAQKRSAALISAITSTLVTGLSIISCQMLFIVDNTDHHY